MVKVLTIFFLITLQLALQIGVPIHKHFCDMDGAFASVLVKVDHQCAEPHTDLPPCCQKEQTKDNCCSDEVEVVKTNLDQLNSDQPNFSFEPFEFSVFLNPSFDRFFSRHRSHTPPSKFPQKRPPPLWRAGRYIQTFHQTWQI
jgi:hypothetical protein